MKIEVFTVHLCVVNAVWSRPFFLDECHRKLSLHPSTVRLFHATPCCAMSRRALLYHATPYCAALCCAVLRCAVSCRAALGLAAPCNPVPLPLTSCVVPSPCYAAMPCLGRLGQIEPVVSRRVHCLRLSSA